nr:hypothetical protein [Tanacetum cinerariifolium]
MNQNFYNSNSSGFDQSQPPQYLVIHQPRQEMSTKMLLAKEKLIKALRTCLKNNNQPPEEKSIAILLAEESILTVIQTLEEKQIDTESMQELLLQLFKDLQTLGNTSNQLNQEEQDSSQYWKPPIYYSDNDDDFYRESIDETPPSDAIAPDLPITNSLVMDNKHLDTILEMNSDEEIESSVKNLNLTPSEFEDLFDYVSECDLPFCDNSPDFNNVYEILNYPLFDSKDDYISSDDESSSEEYVLIDFILEEFAGEPALINLIPPGIAETKFDPKYGYVYADDESDSGDLTTKVVDDISDNLTRELYVHVPNVLITLPTIYPVFDTLLPLSSENKDKVFNPGILISKEEKSPLLSHRGLKVFHLINYSESPMMIYGGDMPILTISSMRDRVKLVTRLTKTKRFSGGNPCSVFFLFFNKCDVRRLSSSNLVFVMIGRIPQIMKTLVLVVLSSAHLVFIHWHATLGIIYP